MRASSRVRKRVGAGVAVRGQADAVDLDAFGLQTSLGVIPEALERGRGHLIEIVRRVAFDAGLDEGRAGAPLATTPTASGSCMTRRSVVDWKAGTRPTPFTRRAPSTREGQRIQLYVDVSNSMSRWLPRIVGEIGCVLEAFIEPVILAFAAGEVEPWRGHAGGLRRALTRGGTSFAPVAEDMRARGVRHALVISDGVGANPDPDCLEALARRGTRVALVFPEDAVPHPLDAISPARWRFGLGLPRIRVGYF